MREIPRDPFTGKNDTWVTVPPPADSGSSGSSSFGSTPLTGGSGNTGPGNVYDVHSGSDLIGTTGTPYNEW
jgi:general secretion pathway protein G